MKIRKFNIRIKDLRSMLDDVVKAGEAIEQGKRLKPVKEPELYFTSFEALRKALTPKRLELLHVIKASKPQSINELARIAKRDVKNISDDVNYLEKIGLVEKAEGKHKTALLINYDRIAFEIAV